MDRYQAGLEADRSAVSYFQPGSWRGRWQDAPDDQDVARQKWTEEAKNEPEKKKREQSDFLAHCNDAGLYADFHSCRHLFITSLERAGVRPKMAQTLARHSDIRLTLQTYTHIELHDQSAAVRSLPDPSGDAGRSDDNPPKLDVAG